MESLQYLDFELKIERDGENYIARVLRSPIGEASSIFSLPFSEEKIELLVLKIGRLNRSTRRIHSAEMDAARELGGKLFEAVFSGEVRACLRSSIEEANRKDETGLRLKLRLQDVAELADLPWEFLFDKTFDRFLAQSNQTPIVRYIEMPERIKPFAVRLPLQVLVMISSPVDYARLDVEREKAMLQKAIQPLSEQRKVRVKWLEKPTLAALQRCLRDGEFHIFHFIGHGGFNQKTEEGVLVLEDEQGRGWQAGAHRIGTILHDHRSLRLAVLNACEGARNSRTDPFAGVATTLIRHGLPAVVAMQFEITDDAAIIFAGEFYTALAEGLPVDTAVAEARKAIYAQPNDIEWGTPVLYTRAPDGVLFDVEGVQPPIVYVPAPQEKEPIKAKPPSDMKSDQGMVAQPAVLFEKESVRTKLPSGIDSVDTSDRKLWRKSVSKPILGLIVGVMLGTLGWVFLLGFGVHATLVEISLTGLIGFIVGFFAYKVNSIPKGLIFGFVTGLLFLITEYVLELAELYLFQSEYMGIHPIVGLILGYVTQRYGKDSNRTKLPSGIDSVDTSDRKLWRKSVSKPRLGLIVGTMLGIFDGLLGVSVFGAVVIEVVILSLEQLVVGLIVGLFAQKINSIPKGLIFGFVAGLFFWAIAWVIIIIATFREVSYSMWFGGIRIIIDPIVGLILGYITQRYGKASNSR